MNGNGFYSPNGRKDGPTSQSGQNRTAASNGNKNGFSIPDGMGYDAYQGSIQQILRENIGQYMDVEFLMGTGPLTTRSGRLTNVGVSYIVLYDQSKDRYLICDLYSIKFVTIYSP